MSVSTKDSISVFIDGFKEGFRSKRAIKKLKNTVRNMKEGTPLDNEIFFKSGYDCEISKKDNNYIVNIIKTKELLEFEAKQKEEEERLQRRKELREQLRNRRYYRSGGAKRELSKLKKKVPKKVFKTYLDFKRTFDVPVPSPEEIMSEPQKYTQLIQMYASGAKLSPDENFNKKINKYFKEIGDMMGIEGVDPTLFSPDNLKMMAEAMNNAQTSDEPSTTVQLDDGNSTEYESDSDDADDDSVTEEKGECSCCH